MPPLFFPEVLPDNMHKAVKTRQEKCPIFSPTRILFRVFPYIQGTFHKQELLLLSAKLECLVYAGHWLKASQTLPCLISLTVGRINIPILQIERLRPKDCDWSESHS